jgi:hypothetical protein
MWSDLSCARLGCSRRAAQWLAGYEKSRARWLVRLAALGLPFGPPSEQGAPCDAAPGGHAARKKAVRRAKPRMWVAIHGVPPRRTECTARAMERGPEFLPIRADFGRPVSRGLTNLSMPRRVRLIHFRGAQSHSSVESASKTTRISFSIKEAPAAAPWYGEDARRRAGTKERVRGADSTELWDSVARALRKVGER